MEIIVHTFVEKLRKKLKTSLKVMSIRNKNKAK